MITVIRKGTRAFQELPAVPGRVRVAAAVSAQVQGLVPAGRDQPLWWTLRRAVRPLTYDAARTDVHPGEAALGANCSLHDLRHTAAYRMARDPAMPLTDVILSFRVSRGRDLRRPVEDSVADGTLAA